MKHVFFLIFSLVYKSYTLLSTVQITMCIQQVWYALVIIQIGAVHFTLCYFLSISLQNAPRLKYFFLPSVRDEVKWKTENFFEGERKKAGREAKSSFALNKNWNSFYLWLDFIFAITTIPVAFHVTIIIFGNSWEALK